MKLALEDYMMPCLTKKYFGIECFGCGTQRAFAMLLEGDFKGAFQMYPAIYTIVLLVFFIILNFVDKKRNYSRFLIWLGIINGIVILVSYFWKHSYYFI